MIRMIEHIKTKIFSCLQLLLKLFPPDICPLFDIVSDDRGDDDDGEENGNDDDVVDDDDDDLWWVKEFIVIYEGDV